MLIVPTKKKILPSSTCRRLPSSSFSTSTSKSNSNSVTDTSKQNVSSLETLNTRVTSIQKNLGSTKRQIKALSIYPDRAIRQDASLRLKVAQLELTLKHVFDQSTGLVKKEELDECIAALSVLKQAI
jgi:predicted  nucleic acid-binding Zn-ribbon protein